MDILLLAQLVFTLGGSAGTLGALPGPEVGLTVTRGALEAASSVDFAQKRGEAGLSRAVVQQVTLGARHVVAGARLSRRFGTWAKWSLSCLAGVEAGAWRVDVRQTVAESFPDRSLTVEARWRRDSARLRVEVEAGVQRHARGIGFFEVLRVGRIFKGAGRR